MKLLWQRSMHNLNYPWFNKTSATPASLITLRTFRARLSLLTAVVCISITIHLKDFQSKIKVPSKSIQLFSNMLMSSSLVHTWKKAKTKGKRSRVRLWAWNHETESKHDEPCTCAVRKWVFQRFTHQDQGHILLLNGTKRPVKYELWYGGGIAGIRIRQPQQKSPPRGSDLRMTVTPSQFRWMSIHKTQKHSYLNDDTLISLSDTGFPLSVKSGEYIQYSVKLFIFIFLRDFQYFYSERMRYIKKCYNISQYKNASICIV